MVKMSGLLRIPDRFFILGLFFIGLLVRLLFFFAVVQRPENSLVVKDSEQYYQIAQSLSSGKGFFDESSGLYANRLPGYSLFLAGIINILGDSLLWICLTQIIIFSCIPVLLYFVSLKLFPYDFLVARCIGLLAIVYFPLILYATIIFAESLFVLLLLCFLLVLLSNSNTASNKFLAGVLFGLASLVRPVGHYFLVIGFIVYGGIALWERVSLRLVAKNVFFVFIGWSVTIAPWLIRNFFLFGSLFFHTLPGIHFLQYSATHTYSIAQKISPNEARKKLFSDVEKKVQEHTEIIGHRPTEYELCCLREKVAVKVLKKNGFAFMQDSLKNWIRTLFCLYVSPLVFKLEGWPPPGIDYSSLYSTVCSYLNPTFENFFLRWVIYWDLLFLILFWFFVIAILIAAWHRLIAFRLFFSGIIFAGLFIFLTLSFGGARFRLPAEMIIFVFGVYATINLLRSFGWCCQSFKKL